MMVTKEHIETLLMTRDDALIRALVALNNRQTTDEQNSEVTKYHNNRGFKPCDARKGTGMVKFYQRTGFLTTKQLAHWRKVMPGTKKPRICSYAGQLLIVAKEKKAASQPKLIG